MSYSFASHKSWKPSSPLPISYAGRNYECLQLSSGLNCILVNDASTFTISAAVAFGGGSFMDFGVPGLAHLCEHVVCSRGTLVELQRILLGCNGSFSATTGSDQTTFGFDISTFAHESVGEGHFLLDKVLQKFASIFDPPRISGTIVLREIGFVDDEHNMNTSNEDKILWHGLRLLANCRHPFSNFATGNKSTLSGISGLKRMISSYHSRVFRPENAAIVIKGPQSINRLRKSLSNAFDDLHFKKTKKADDDLDLHSIQDLFSNEFNSIFIKSGSRTVRLIFSMKKGFLGVPATIQSILCNILGDESESSLCHYLRDKKCYIHHLFVYTQSVSSDEELFIIAAQATKLGMSWLSDLLATIFFYIEEIIAKLPQPVWKTVAQEYLEINEYLYNSTVEEEEEVASYAENLQRGLHFLRGDWNPACLEEQSLAFYMSQFFGRSQVKLQILDSNPKILSQFSQMQSLVVDEYFHFEYCRFWCYHSQTVSVPNLCVAQPIGKLMEVVPDLLEYPKPEFMGKYRHLLDNPERPTLKYRDPKKEVWSVNSPLNSRSSASIYLHFQSLPQDATFLVLLEMIAAICGQSLKSRLYNFELFGFTWGIHANIHGEPSFLITAGGTPSAITHMLKTITHELLSFSSRTCRYHELKSARIHLRGKYEEYIQKQGIRFAHVMLYQLLEEGIVQPEDRIQALELLDVDSLSHLSQVVHHPSFTRILLSGNFSKDQMESINKMCDGERIEWSEKHAINRRVSSSVSLRKGAFYEYKLPQNNDPVAVVLYYIQLGQREDIYTFTLSKVLQQMLQSSAHHNLRDKRGLAYTISTGLKVFRHHFGMHVTIPTTKHSTGYVISEIEEYFRDVEASVAEMSEADFETKVKMPFLQDLQDEYEKDPNPSALFASIQPLQGSHTQSQHASFQRHWCAMDQIILQTYRFGSKDCEEAVDFSAVKQLSLADFRAFFSVKFAVNSTSRSALLITQSNDTREPKKLFSVRQRRHTRPRKVVTSIHSFKTEVYRGTA